MILELVSVIAGFKPQPEGYIQHIENQRVQIAHLEVRVKELESQVKQSSRNSSRPPQGKRIMVRASCQKRSRQKQSPATKNSSNWRIGKNRHLPLRSVNSMAILSMNFIPYYRAVCLSIVA